MLRRGLNLLVNPAAAYPGEPVLARVVGVLFLAGGCLGTISLVLPHPAEAHDGAVLAISLGALAIGAGFLSTPRSIPVWMVHLTIGLGAALICVATYFTGIAESVYTTMFIWVALFTAYFFSARWALGHLAWLLGCYAVALVALDTSDGWSPFTRWLLTAIALVVATGMTSWLVAKRRAAEARAGQFFDLSKDLLCTADRDGFLVELNDAWTSTLGYSLKELRARPWGELVHPDDLAATVAEAERVFEGEPTQDFECRYLAKDGSWVWLSWSATYEPAQDLLYARATDITERQKLLDRLHSQAGTDQLTGLPNRRRLSEECERETARAARHGSALSLAVLDLDHFKRFNDERGHMAGDELLCAAVRAWQTALRATDFLARYGGEEFVVLLPDCELETAREVIERVRVATPSGQSCSAGVVRWQPGESPESAIARADEALYEAKRAGRDRVVVAPANGAVAEVEVARVEPESAATPVSEPG